MVYAGNDLEAERAEKYGRQQRKTFQKGLSVVIIPHVDAKIPKDIRHEVYTKP
jgi:hypothetical protein